MGAPKQANTVNATIAKRRKALERKADVLREAGWLVVSPQDRAAWQELAQPPVQE